MSDLYKHPKTGHPPYSPGVQNDDKIIKDLSRLEQSKDGIVTSFKMDGECTTMYPTKYHARSLDSKHHPSRNFVKGIWGSINYLIPEGWRIVGENVYGHHSIFYDNLDSFFYVFNVYNEKNICLSYDDTLYVCKDLGLVHVPVLYEGPYDEKILRDLHKDPRLVGHEGWVTRVRGEFHYEDFGSCVMKYVREGHVQTDEHWMEKPVVPNLLRK